MKFYKAYRAEDFLNTALVIVDVQNDYFSGGRMELSASPDAVSKIKELLDIFRTMEMPVVHVRNIYVKPEGLLFYPEAIGAAIHHDVVPVEGEKEVLKNYPNSFRGTDLDAYLKENKITKLVVTGMMTHLCIDSTVRAAFDLGYECILVGDCCATRSLSFHNVHISAEDVQKTFLAALDGIFAKVVLKRTVVEYYRKRNPKLKYFI